MNLNRSAPGSRSYSPALAWRAGIFCLSSLIAASNFSGAARAADGPMGVERVARLTTVGYETPSAGTDEATRWVQIDLGRTATISTIALWHFHSEFAVYKDVVVQVSNDKDFVEGVTTVFNNDRKNASGMGAGADPLYFESFQGRAINAKGAKGRYVRLYSNGSTAGDENRYTEIEVYGK